MRRVIHAAAAALLLACLTAGCGGNGPRQTAEYELEKAAPEEWEAYQAAQKGLKNAQKAFKKEAPDEWRVLKAALEKRETARQKQEAAEKAHLSAKTEFEKAEKASLNARGRFRLAWEARKDAIPETYQREAADEAYKEAQAEYEVVFKKRNEAEAKNKQTQTARLRSERELNAANTAVLEAAGAASKAAPKETAVMEAYQTDQLAAQKALEQKAPHWWRAYQAAEPEMELP